MRYYKIIAGDTTYESAPGGVFDPGALNVEFDITVTAQDIPSSEGGAFVRIWGIPLQTISQSNNLNTKPIQVFGGMSQGLPLANPAQQGLLTQGTIYPAFGNWIGTDMTLDMVIVPGFGTPTEVRAKNVVHNWPQGQPLSNAIKNALSTAFPTFKLNIQISDKLVQAFDDTGFYQTLEQYAGYVKQISQSILGTNKYPGVSIAASGTTINVTDGTQTASGQPKVIAFQDMIGQPTWLGLNNLSMKTVMRGDIKCFDMITLPQSLATINASSGSQLPNSKATSVFQGNFQVTGVRHVGNFRQPDAAAWVTIFNLLAQP